jgi:putative aldouronate transport system substrate-binding protein
MTRTHARPAAKLLAAVMALMLITAAVAGCSSTSSPTQQPTTAPATTTAATATAAPSTDPLQPDYDASMYPEAITIDCYSDGGTYNGLQPEGWFSKIVQEQFNMKINIIGGQSAAGDTIFQTRSAAGNLGDLIYTSNQHLSDSIKAGDLILDITDLYSTKMTAYSAQFEAAEKNLQTFLNTDKVYGLPTTVSSQSPLSPNTDGANPQYGSYMRLDAYIGIGAPPINSLDDLLPTLQKMVEKYPKNDAGKQTYAFSLFKDWDGGGCMQNAGLIAYQYGWTRVNVCFYNPSNGQTQSYLDETGYYKKALDLYFKANQLGLMDPDSITQDWNTIESDKFGNGQIMYSWWSWLGIPGFNTPDHVAAAKGYAYVPIADQKLYSDGVSPYGTGYSIAIGQGAKDPARLADFINWMSSPDGFMTMYNGPEGLAWTLDADKQPVLTDLGKVALAGGRAAAPGPDVSAEYGGGQFVTGAPVNIGTMILMWRGTEINPILNCPYDSRLWTSTLTTGATELDKLWQKTFGANSVIDYLKSKDRLIVSSPSSYIAPPLTTDQNTMMQQVSQEIVNSSWKMIFAKDQAEFDSIWQTMVTNAKGLGFDDLLALDQKQAADMYAAQQQFITQYNASKSGQ